MEYNQPSQIVKDLNFGSDAKSKVILGVDKLSRGVKSTLGPSGKCVIHEDARGKPVITKDGVTVAQSIILLDPVENMGATLIKEAASLTVKEAGDGTTTAIVLAEALLKEVNEPAYKDYSIREIKLGIDSGLEKVNDYLSESSIPVEGDMLKHVSSISCNNDEELGGIIAEAYEKVGDSGIVLHERSDTEETYTDIVKGVTFDSGLTSPHLVTNSDKNTAELDNPYVLIVSSPIPNVRKIQVILEHVIKTKRSLLIVAEVDQQVKAALLMNKIKGNISVNIIPLPGFGPSKNDTIEDLSILTGAKVINEELGDDLDLIQADVLGEVNKSVTDDKSTVLTLSTISDEVEGRIKNVKKLIKEEKDPFLKTKLEQRLGMLSGSVGVIRVGANSEIELKEKLDRVEDAVYATKAALKEGVVSGAGVALLNASQQLEKSNDIGEQILAKAMKSPFTTILANGGIENYDTPKQKGFGYNAINGELVNLVNEGVVDPALVTKTALKNAVSVVKTIISADCVISNVRASHESS